ncbi:MAG: hypothetical protein DI539_17885 [Flavobacterium psychrophilum]|nr:MAG: hypothetical protein DI539_17885 [Flavobacterium psychrophilum]
MTKVQCYLEIAKKDQLLNKILHHESGKNSLQILELYIKNSKEETSEDVYSVWALVKHSTMGGLDHLPLNHIERFYKESQPKP